MSYFTGPPERWRTGLPTYAGLRYRDLWPGIDLIWRAEDGRLKQLFQVQPGADPAQIRLTYRGVHALTVERDGSLVVTTPSGTLRDEAPRAWQEIAGEVVEVPAAYRLEESGGDGWAYGFTLGAHDRSHPMLIDPALFLNAGFIGGGGDGRGRRGRVGCGWRGLHRRDYRFGRGELPGWRRIRRAAAT